MFFWKSKKTEELPQLNRVELDVREELRNKRDPFAIIMKTVKDLDKQDMLVLHATLKPVPLLGLMKLKGYVSTTAKAGHEHWITTFVRKEYAALLQGEQDELPEAGAQGHGEEHEGCPASAAPQPEASDDGSPRSIHLDNRGLEPPKPMIRTMDALEKARPGDTITIHNDRVPAFLLEEIKNLGYPHQIEPQPDGSAIVTIHKP
ncbi:MAG: hypothetical protein K0Q90_182 [Paenibacillaceae bacterium]|jgi:uncharacterized protein (DUF2249 family)|nr:hypothetical protein [Paenibacillaceae bacterium]